MAQTPIAIADAAAPSPGSSIAAQAITVSLVAVPLTTALDVIAAKADLRVVYRSTLFAGDPKVSLQARGIRVDDAFAAVLRGTGVSAVLNAHGHVVLVRQVSQRVQTNGTIVGKVIHAKTKQPVAGVKVVLDGVQPGVTTAADGTFGLTVAEGEHTIRLRGIGLTRQARRVVVIAGESVSLEIVMEPSTSVLDEVVVTGTVVATERKAIATPITVIHGDELERRGITRIEQLFRGEVPGVLALERGASDYSDTDVGQGVRSQVYSRGSASLNGGANPIKTYVDGVELVDPSYLGTIDPQSIEKIEIILGPQAATVYGSGALGGVMQIFTRRGHAKPYPEVTVTAKYGVLENSFSPGKTPAHNDVISLRGSSGPQLSYAGNLSYNYTGQWQPKLYNRRYAASLGGTHSRERFTVGATFSTLASAQGTWKQVTGGEYQYYGNLELAREGHLLLTNSFNPLAFFSDRVSVSSSQSFSLNVDYRATTMWQHHVTVGRSQNTMMLKPVAPAFASGVVGADSLYLMRRVSGQRFTWNYNTSYVKTAGWLSSALTVGANGAMADQISVNGGLLNPSATTVLGLSGTPGPQVTLPLNDKGWGSFMQWRVGFFGSLYTAVGMRVEQNPSYGREVKFDFTPTNGLTYTIERRGVSLKLMGSYGRATRPPPASYREEVLEGDARFTPARYIAIFSNPNLRPEYSRGPQGGMEVYIGNFGSFTLNHYQQTVTDLIQRVFVDSTWVVYNVDGTQWVRQQSRYLNMAKVRQFGWDGTGTVHLGPLDIKGAYSWSDSRVLSLNTNVYGFISYRRGDSFRNIATHTGNMSVGYARGASALMFVTNYVGARGSDGDRRHYETSLARLRVYALRNFMGSGVAVRRLPGYTKTDITSSHRLTPQLTLTANILNAGNSFGSDLGNLVPTLGRQTTFGFSYRFGKR